MRVGLVILWLAALSTPAFAQDRGYVLGTGGATFMERTAGVFGVEGGFHITRDVIVYGQAGRMLDVLPASVQDDIESGAATLSALTGRTWRFDAHIKATYFGGGVKYILPIGTTVRPYIAGTVGGATYQGTLTEAELGDVLDDAVALGLIKANDVKGTDVAYELGGGVLVPRGRLQFEAGYRLMNVKGVSVSRVIAGAGIRF
jgi:hypothetical protein